uniref:Uncharacterized protein n=1 Tax=Alexandrium monilatum TaxID=311494 RepID=A0A7S4PZ93_9DINO
MKEVCEDKANDVVVSGRMAGSPRATTTSENSWVANMEWATKEPALRGNSMIPPMVARWVVDVSPKHSTMKELKAKAAADETDIAVKCINWLRFGTSLMASDSCPEAAVQFADRVRQFGDRVHRMLVIFLNLRQVPWDDCNLRPGEEVDDAADEASKVVEF